jgi:hypothetical protein
MRSVVDASVNAYSRAVKRWSRAALGVAVVVIVTPIPAEAGASATPVNAHVRIGPPVSSPGGREVAFAKVVGLVGHLMAGPSHGTAKSLYSSTAPCCSQLVWASDRLLVFDDGGRVKTVDVVSGRVRWIAEFSRYVLSRDDRWVAGWIDSGGHSPAVVGVVSVSGSDCRAVPKPANADDSRASFSPDGKRVRYLRRTMDAGSGALTAGHWVTVNLSALPRESVAACLTGQY